MNVLTKARLLIHIARWRAGWYRQNTQFAVTVPGNPKFMGPRDAVRECIQDGDVIGISGLGGNQRVSMLYWGIRDVFLETGHPRDLTAVAIGGIGGRSRIPGTLEELGKEGLVTRFITGHMETFKSLLRLGDEGKVELQVLPQGLMALMIDGQSRGETTLEHTTGIGTFVDPRVGRGSPLANTDEQLVTVVGDKLRYELPKITVGMFNAPAADRKGNIYMKNTAMIAESGELARAARANGGKVIVNVGMIVDEGYDEVFLPADDVDAIVVWKGTEQTGSIPHRRYWSMFTTQSDMPVVEAIERARFANVVLGITPRRKPIEHATARLAGSIFARNAEPGAFVNIGVGLPEEVCRLMLSAGITEQITLFTESGVIGGVPAPGVFFGAAACPERMVSSAQVFKKCYENLDVTILGVLQADSHGNVNVSKRGEGAINYVGPGGFIDLTTAANMVVFVSSWMAGGRITLEDGRVRIGERGKVKFVDQVDEITFNGQEALKTGKKVFYVTNVGTFHLTPRGMELVNVMPGVDVQRDIVEATSMKVVLPESGHVPVVSDEIVTGQGFRLQLARPAKVAV